MPKLRRLKCFFFWRLKCLFFGILNANISNTNTTFWHLKHPKCFVKLHQSYTPFLAFKMPAFSVMKLTPAGYIKTVKTAVFRPKFFYLVKTKKTPFFGRFCQIEKFPSKKHPKKQSFLRFQRLNITPRY